MSVLERGGNAFDVAAAGFVLRPIGGIRPDTSTLPFPAMVSATRRGKAGTLACPGPSGLAREK